MAKPKRPAVFLDRDGTLIRYHPYLTDAALVRLLPGSAEALRRLRAAGFACVMVTNQSALAKGLMTEADLEWIHAELHRQLAEEGTALDGFYHCPLASVGDDPTRVEFVDRKPGPGMLLRAAEEHGLDLSRSWMVGDNVSDVWAGRNAGCRGTILLANPELPASPDERLPPGCIRRPDLLSAAEHILSRTS